MQAEGRTNLKREGSGGGREEGEPSRVEGKLIRGGKKRRKGVELGDTPRL